MNRLSPLIERRAGRYAPAFAGHFHANAAAAEAQSDSLRFFANCWCGGLIFFATFLA